MKPFFSYYGSKFTMAPHYGPPRMDKVIEPFAGSAAYSVRMNPKQVQLYDVSEDIVELWSWLIGSTERDVASIPSMFDGMDEVLSLQKGPQLLVRFWIAKGRSEPSGKLSPWYFQYRESHDCKVWGDAVKRRIITQKPNISHWKIDLLSYDKIPLEEAHWHVDPPYNNAAGSRYPNSDIDFSHLGDWCKCLPGEVDVCENDGATWLPFEMLHSVVSSRGRRTGYKSKEAVWRKP